jgi:hypothetical protein
VFQWFLSQRSHCVTCGPTHNITNGAVCGVCCCSMALSPSGTTLLVANSDSGLRRFQLDLRSKVPGLIEVSGGWGVGGCVGGRGGGGGGYSTPQQQRQAQQVQQQGAWAYRGIRSVGQTATPRSRCSSSSQQQPEQQ